MGNPGRLTDVELSVLRAQIMDGYVEPDDWVILNRLQREYGTLNRALLSHIEALRAELADRRAEPSESTFGAHREEPPRPTRIQRRPATAGLLARLISSFWATVGRT
jgi:hypothetical protein